MAENLDEVIQVAKWTLEVLSRVPMLFDEEARKAGNLVYEWVMKLTCETALEKEAWERVFNHSMPITDGDAKRIELELDDELHKA